MQDMDREVKTLVETVAGYREIRQDGIRDSLAPWRKLLTGTWAAHTILFGGALALQVAAWIGLANMGVLRSEDPGTGWVLGMIGLSLLNATWFIGLVVSMGTGMAADLASHFLATPEGSVPMQQLRHRAGMAVRRIRRIKGSSVDRKALRSKLTEMRKVARVEGFAVKFLAAQLTAMESECTVDSFLQGRNAQREALSSMEQTDRELALDAASTIQACRQEVARVTVALQKVLEVEEEKLKTREEHAQAKAKLAEVQRQQAFVDKKRMRLAEAPQISTDGLIEHVVAATDEILADKKATQEIRRLTEK